MAIQRLKQSMIAAVLLITMAVLFYCFYGGEALLNNFLIWLDAKAPEGNFSREIGTNKDFWLNGYLGILFRFNCFGVLNWLALPMGFYFFATIKKRERWEIAIALVLILSCVFIAVYGYKNHRYQLTNYPPLLTVIFLFGWETFSKFDRKKKCMVLSGAVCIIVLFSGLMIKKFYSFKDMGASYWKGDIYEKILGGPFPYGVLEYIDNQLPDNSVIKGDTKILLYYYYDKNQLFNPGEGKKESIKNIYRLVKNKALSNQILTSGNQKYKLYRIIPKNERKAFFKKRKLVFRTIFSNWTGKDTIPMNDISNAEPFLSLFGWRGEFVFKRISTEKDNIARLTMSNTRLFERPGIQFGFKYPSDKWPLDIKAGDIVSIHTQVRMSEQFDSKPELFIQDKTENRGWLRENLNWKQRKKKQKKWKSVLVTRKIRDGFTDIQMGIAWEPKSNEEWFEIKNINIYVTKEK